MNEFNDYHQGADVSGFNSNSFSILSFIFGNMFIFYGLLIGELVLVFVLSRNVKKFSYGTASLLFMLYSFINGLTLASIFIAYRLGTISTAFVTAAALFGAMAIYGKMTKKDISGWGSFLRMGLFGIIIAMVINIFIGSEAMDFVISGVGVFVFAGLTAWDMQKLKSYYYSYGETGLANNIAIMGALSLYLDFINIFIFLLRIFGSRD